MYEIKKKISKGIQNLESLKGKMQYSVLRECHIPKEGYKMLQEMAIL